MGCRAVALTEKCKAYDPASFAIILHVLTKLESASILTAYYAYLKLIFSI